MSTISNKRARELLEYESILKTPSGRAVLFRCLEAAGLYSETFHQDSHIHARMSGMRSHGLWLESELKAASPELYMTMIKEHV